MTTATATTSVPLDEALPLATIRERAPVNLRSVVLGLLGVVFICGLTPYNDYVMFSTPLVGNFLPIGLLLFFLVFIVLINGPLNKWAPRYALSTGEMAVALGMALVTCTLPSSGLMRYLPITLVGLWERAGESAEYASLLGGFDLPNWMFPTFESEDPRRRATDRIVRYFVQRVPMGEQFNYWVPWIVPALTWGVFLAAVYGMVICMAVLVRRQWVENERLQFPLANLYLSLLERPKPGQALNSVLRSRSFWIAFGVVFVVHAFNALHQYQSKYWPEIPLRFDLSGLFSEAPWSHMEWFAKTSALYFSIVGITYFVQSKIAFSLWATFVILQVVRMSLGTFQTTISAPMENDQFMGALVPFVLTILWVGRHQWAAVGRQMISPPSLGPYFHRLNSTFSARRQRASAITRPLYGFAVTTTAWLEDVFSRFVRADDPRGRYLPYAIAGWGFVLCSAGMVAWLVLAGMTLGVAMLMVLMLILIYLALARVVAETGLIFVQFGTPLPLHRPLTFALNALPAPMQIRTTVKSFFLSTLFHRTFIDIREGASVYATHALRVADAGYDEQKGSGAGRAVMFTLALVLAMVVGYFVAGASMLRVEYSHAATLDVNQQSPINPYAHGEVKNGILDPTLAYRPPGTGGVETHSGLGHFTFGAALTSFLSYMRLRFAGWPFHPVGYLLVFSYPMRIMWFSLFVGWLLKITVLKLGGTTLFRAARPLFIGMIIGEAGAAAFWVVVSLVLHSMGMTYHRIELLVG